MSHILTPSVTARGSGLQERRPWLIKVRLNVESVEIEVRSEFLDRGIVLIDIPGVGSTFVHNTRAAEAVLVECDAAVFIVSADPPITEVEVTYLRKVRELIPKIFLP